MTTSLTTTMPLDTPIGRLVLESDGDVLIGVWLPDERRHGRRDADDVPTVLKETASQLEEYFAGERTEFDVPMELDGTPFQKEVWAELSRIGYGETISYGELARRVGPPPGTACGGAGQRAQSDTDHRPLPPSAGQQRDRWLRRRPEGQARPAGDRRRDGLRAHRPKSTST